MATNEEQQGFVDKRIRLGGLWKKTSAKGRVYYQGAISDTLSILLFEVDKKTDRSPDFEAFITERPRKKDDGSQSTTSDKSSASFNPPEDTDDDFPVE